MKRKKHENMVKWKNSNDDKEEDWDEEIFVGSLSKIQKYNKRWIVILSHLNKWLNNE